MTNLRWACLPTLLLLACDSNAPEHPDTPEPEPVRQAAQAPQDAADRDAQPQPQPDAAQAPAPSVVAIEVSLVEVRMSSGAATGSEVPAGETVEIEVELPRPLAPTGAVRPSLKIGDEVTHRSRAGRDGRLDRLIFVVPAAQYARMSQSEGIVVRAGLFSNEASLARPRLSEAK